MLTEKQKAFCDYYIQTLNATESAIKAGYSEKTAKVIGCENLTKPNIQKYLEERNKKIESERIADMTEIKEFWSEVVRGKRNKMNDRLKASEYIAKTNGAFLDKVEHSGDIEITVGFAHEED